MLHLLSKTYRNKELYLILVRWYRQHFNAIINEDLKRSVRIWKMTNAMMKIVLTIMEKKN